MELRQWKGQAMKIWAKEKGYPLAPETPKEAEIKYFAVMRFCLACAYVNDRNSKKHWNSHWTYFGTLMDRAKC